MAQGVTKYTHLMTSEHRDRCKTGLVGWLELQATVVARFFKRYLPDRDNCNEDKYRGQSNCNHEQISRYTHHNLPKVVPSTETQGSQKASLTQFK